MTIDVENFTGTGWLALTEDERRWVLNKLKEQDDDR